MSLDPCIPQAPHTAAPAVPHRFHRLSHHIGSRHVRRIRHIHAANPAAPEPSYNCGKHLADFAENQSQPGGLAARPTDGGQTLAAVKGKAVAAKLAAAGAASLLGAAALAGALATPAGFGSGPAAGYVARGGSQPSVASLASSPGTPGSDNQQAPTVSPITPGSHRQPAPAVTAPVTSPAVGPAPTPVPEPSSLALLGGFATLLLATSVLRKAAKPFFSMARSNNRLHPRTRSSIDRN